MNIKDLEKRVAETRAAWKAAGSPRGDHPLFLAGVEANKALQAAKRAAAPSQAEESARLGELQRAAMAAQEERERIAKRDADLQRAVAAVDRAWDFPRHGEGWGDYPGEQSAIRVLGQNGLRVDDMGRIVRTEK